MGSRSPKYLRAMLSVSTMAYLSASADSAFPRKPLDRRRGPRRTRALRSRQDLRPDATGAECRGGFSGGRSRIRPGRLSRRRLRSHPRREAARPVSLAAAAFLAGPARELCPDGAPAPDAPQSAFLDQRRRIGPRPDGLPAGVPSQGPLVRDPPLGSDQPVLFELLEEGIEHRLRPVQRARGHLLHLLDDLVAIALAPFQDGQDDGFRRCARQGLGDYVLPRFIRYLTPLGRTYRARPRRRDPWAARRAPAAGCPLSDGACPVSDRRPKGAGPRLRASMRTWGTGAPPQSPARSSSR
jgi:hypothetical protein